MGQRGLQHVEALAQLQREEVVNLTALADPFPENLDFEKVTRFAPSFSEAGVARYTDADELIENAEVDAIWFAVPPNQHSGEVIRAAQRDIATFVEKPQSLFYDEVAEMADAIDDAGVPATVGFQMRYDPWYIAISEFLSDKWTASVTLVNAGGIEGHGRKHTHAELRGGPAHRVWTGDRSTGPARPLWRPAFTRPTSSAFGPATRSSGYRRLTQNGRMTCTPSRVTTPSPIPSHTVCQAAAWET